MKWRNGRYDLKVVILIETQFFIVHKMVHKSREKIRNAFLNAEMKNKAGYTAQDAPSMHTFHLRK